MTVRTLAALALLAMATPAMAQWNSYHQPGSPWTNYNGPNGQTGNSYHQPGSPWTNSTINDGNGQMHSCQTYHQPGSPWANTNCN